MKCWMTLKVNFFSSLQKKISTSIQIIWIFLFNTLINVFVIMTVAFCFIHTFRCLKKRRKSRNLILLIRSKFFSMKFWNLFWKNCHNSMFINFFSFRNFFDFSIKLVNWLWWNDSISNAIADFIISCVYNDANKTSEYLANNAAEKKQNEMMLINIKQLKQRSMLYYQNCVLLQLLTNCSRTMF